MLSKELIHNFPSKCLRVVTLQGLEKKKIWGSLYPLVSTPCCVMRFLHNYPETCWEISHILFFSSSDFMPCCEQPLIRKQTDKANPISFVNSPCQALGTSKAMALFSPRWGFVFHVGTQSQEHQREGEIPNSGVGIWTILQRQHVLLFSLKGSSAF